MASKQPAESVSAHRVDTTSDTAVHDKDVETIQPIPGKEDVAAAFANYFESHETYSDKEAKQLRWKLDYRLIPLLWFNSKF